MAISSLEEILEQRRRQQATAQRNAQRTQTRGNPTRTKDDEYKPPSRQPTRVQKDDVYVPPKQTVTPTRQVPKDDKVVVRKPIYEPVKFVPAGNSQRTKDDAVQPQRYVPAPYLPPGKEKDDKSSPERPRYMPVIKPFEIAPSPGMQVGLTGDRPDTNTPGMYQSGQAGAQTVAPGVSEYKPWGGRPKDDEAFPNGRPDPYTPAGAGGVGMISPISPGLNYLNNAVGGQWGKVAGAVAGAAGEAITDKLDQFGAWGANATGQGDPWTALQNTPGGEYARLRDQQRRADDVTAWDKFKSNAWGFVDQTMYVPGKALETTPIPGLGVSAGQVGSAAGEAVNRWANPFNPNQINKEGKGVETPTTNAAFDWMKENLPIDLANGLVPFVQPWTIMWDIGAPQLEKSKQVRANYEALTPEQQQQANIAGVNIISGPDRWQKSIDALLNKDTTVQDLENKARAAMAAGDAQAAAAYGAQAYKLQNTSATDLVDEQSNPWAEIMGGIVFDPTNVLPFGVIGDAWKAYRLKKTFDVAEAVGISRLDDAMKASEKILQGVQPGQVIDMRNWWQKVNPLARTADTEAHMAADQLFSATAQMFGNVTTKQDAIALMQTWLQAPQKLIQGVTGLTSPAMADQAVEGVYKVGAGSVANAPLLEKYPILQRAAAELQNMRSLAGEGAFNPVEFMAEADNIIYQNARKMFGLDAIEALPAGAVDMRLRRLADGTGVIEYLDKGKKVIQTSTPEVFANAQDTYKTLRNNIKNAGGAGGNAVADALRVPDRLQRAIMSDMFLALRPAHWIRNAASATATLMSDGIYGVAPLGERVGFWSGKFGGVVPEAGLFGELEDVTRGVVNQLGDTAGDQNWTRAFWPKNNPYAALVEAGNNFWGGFTNAAGVPFGENAFRMTAFDTAGQRVFRKGWQDAVKNTYAPVLEQLGLDQGIVGRVLNAVTDAGIVGDKAGVAQAARNILSKNTLPFNLRDLNIPDELVSLEAWKKLNSYIADALPTQVDEVADAVRMTFNDELQRYGRILNAAPPQPGVYAWTNVEAAQDGADIIDNLMEAAKRAGIDPAQAQQRAQQLVGGLNQATGKAWENFRQELAQANSPGALNLAMDTWAQYYDLKRAARAEVDGFSKQAIAANSSQAWAQKWQETQRIWQEFGQKSQELFDSGRNSLLTLGQGGDVPKQYDWFDVIKRYVDYDEQAISAARTAGQGVGAPSGLPADNAFSQAIEANRQYLDGSVAEVFDAFRRSPTMESFDLLVNAQRKIDQLGAQAATYLAEKRAEMLPKRAKEYYKLRNNVWAQFFDNAVVHNNATQRLIVADGVAQQAASKLRWTDEFAGGEFKLIGKNADGTWQAMRLDDSSLHNFADPTVKTSSALPTVPKEITNDFYRVTNDTEKIVDDVIKDIKASAAPAPATVTPVAAPVDPKIKKSWQMTRQEFNTEALYQGGGPANIATTDTGRMSNYVTNMPGRAGDYAGKHGDAGQVRITHKSKWADEWTNDIDGVPEAVDANTYWRNNENASTIYPERIQWTDTLPPSATKDPHRYIVEQAVRAGEPVPPNVLAEYPDLIPNARLNVATPVQKAGEPVVKAAQPRLKRETVTTVGDRAAGEVSGIAEARNALRSEWDRVAVGEWQLPKLDTLNMQYNRNGVVNIPENLAEDLYGQTIAGRRIDSQKDVEDLIAEYASMKRQSDKAAATVADSQQFKKLDRTQLLKQFKDELTGAGYSSDDLARMNRREVLNAVETLSGETADEFGMVMYEATAPLIDTDAIDAAYRAQNPYNINLDWSKKTGWDPFGLSKDDSDLYKLIGDTVKRKNPNKAPEMADVAQHMADQLKRAERQIIDRLPEILQGTPNNLTPAQRLQAIDALNQLLPQFDNVLAQSTQAGKDAMNFAMLNFRDRRNIDTALAMVTPFHYFWSRSAMNWGKRVLQKPALLNMWYESERAIGLENQQQDLPQRLQGTLPNPLNQFGIGNERMGNPVNWILPFASYMGNEFSNPDEAQGEFERMYLMWKKWTPGLLPALQYAADTVLDQTSPQTDGRQRADSYQVGDYVPLYRMAGYMKQLFTGENLPQAGDEFDQYRTSRQLAEGATGGADPIASQYAQQIAKNRETGRPDSEGIPPESYDVAMQLYMQASKGAAGDRLESLATGYATGNPTYNYNPEEQQAAATKEAYNTAGYDRWTNPFGSKEAKTAILEDNPDLPVHWSRYDEAPGVTAQYSEAGKLGDTLWDAGNQAVDAMLTANPDAKKADIYEARRQAVLNQAGQAVGADVMAGFIKANPEATPAEIVAFVKEQKFPDADQKTFPDNLDPYKGMNPEEKRQAQLEKFSREAKPDTQRPAYPGDDATKEEKAAYYKALDEFNNSKRQNAVDRMTTLSGDAERGRLEIDATTAGEAYDAYQQRNMTEAEAARVTEIGQQSAQVASYADNWTEYKALGDDNKAKRQYMLDNPEFADYYGEKYDNRWWEESGPGTSGGQWGDEWDDYKALGNSAEKAQYMRDNPEFAAMYKDKYGSAWWENYKGGRGGGSGDFKAAGANVASEFGEEGSATWAEYYALDDDARAAYKAAHPEIKAMTMAGYNPEEYAQAKELFGDEAWMEWASIPAYADTPEAKAARAAYLEEHPQAKLLSAWLNGRPGNFDESQAGDDFAYNFGEDFATAQEMFGEDIWSVWAGYSSGWDKATKRAYHQQYPKLGEMMDWWYGASTGSATGRSPSLSRGGGGGGRSYGGGGGGGYSGWGGGDDSGYRPPVDLNMPYIQNEGLSRELQVEAPRVQGQRRNFSPDWWLKAGDRVGPEKLQRWRPQKQPY